MRVTLKWYAPNLPASLLRSVLILLSLSAPSLTCAYAQQAATDIQTAWRLLDYIAVDYGGAVSHGAITSPSEYAEQAEFASTVAAKIAALPPNSAKGDLQAQIGHLRRVIGEKSDPAIVADNARGLASALLKAYPVPLAPSTAPSFERGATLFNENCASCHGVNGDGKGPAASALSTPPIAFTDLGRARQRSVFALYQAITQGIDGTAMASFARLPTSDRWALAIYAGHFAYPEGAAQKGEAQWRADPSLHALFPDLTTLVGTTPAALEQKLGPDEAGALVAFLRRHPDAVIQQRSDPLALVRERLKESLAIYRAGDRQRAGALALSAYLDEFEPVEPLLGARNSGLLAKIETAMGEYRGAIQQGEDPNLLSRRVVVLDELLNDAQADLSTNAASGVSTFLGAAAILLREGLEALLIVVAMIAFLRKAGRVEAMPYIHAGWTGALVAGAVTWAVATWAIGITGANRELVEGFGSVIAAIVLLWVGIWMHGQSQANQWQRYIREKMSQALSGRSGWFLFGLAFVVVYREVFETILFYAALWTQGNGGAMLAGGGAACVALAIIAWIILRYSRRLPINLFFKYSSWLMAVLTVVLAGKGFSALQEAGYVGIAPLSAIPRIEVIGLFPTLQTIVAQLLMIAALVFGFRWNQRRASTPQRAA